MSGIFNGAIFNPAIFNTGEDALTGFIPRDSVAAITGPVLPVAAVTVPAPTATVVVPSIPAGDVD